MKVHVENMLAMVYVALSFSTILFSPTDSHIFFFPPYRSLLQVYDRFEMPDLRTTLRVLAALDDDVKLQRYGSV